MKKNKKSSFIRLLYLLTPLIALILLGVSLYVWYRALTPGTEVITIVSPVQVKPRAFSAGLEGNIRAALAEFGIDEQNITKRRENNQTVYTILVPLTVSLTLLNLRITTMTQEMGGAVTRGIEGSDGATLALTLGVGRTDTDVVIFRKKGGLEVAAAKIAVLIDDLGIKDISLARRLCELDEVVTLAILPFQRRTSDVIELARSSDTPYILHMPMEPHNADPGEGAIIVGDDRDMVRKKLARAFRSVSGAQGLNNHMGSKATEDLRTMEYVMSYLREENYFFVDSQTSRQSKGYSVSQKSGVRGTMISGYIDVEDNPAAIKQRIDELGRHALDNGSAIILGHDRPATVSVLEKKLPELRGKGIIFVQISDLVH